MKNIKTNLIGLVILALLGLYFFNLITTEQFVASTGFLIAIGFFAAEDQNISGSAEVQGIISPKPPKDK